MRGRAIVLKQTGRTQEQRTGAYAGDIAGIGAASGQERTDLEVLHRLKSTFAAATYEQHYEIFRTVGETGCRGDDDAAVAGYRSQRLADDMNP